MIGVLVDRYNTTNRVARETGRDRERERALVFLK